METMSSTSTLNATTSTINGGTSTGFFPPFTSAHSDAEMQKIQERNKELETENYELTKQLQSTVAHTGRVLEQVTKLQDTNDRLKMRINQVKDYVG